MSLLASATTPADGPVVELHPGRSARVGEGMVLRLLPRRARRLVGPWCFADHFGPSKAAGQIGEHPHVGLQTVTWLLSGRLRHLDSLGNDQTIVPGQLNWMTAGKGITHAEHGALATGDRMHGIQMWVALPEAHRHTDPTFEHHASLPVDTDDVATVTLLAGEAFGEQSPARALSPLVGMEVRASRAGVRRVRLQPAFEHAIVVLVGTAAVDDTTVPAGTMAYLGRGREAIELTLSGDACLMVLGGEPLGEPILMSWNFVVRTAEEVERVTAAYNAGDFPSIEGYTGTRIPAPTAG